MPAQNTSPLDSPKNPPTPKFNSLDGRDGWLQRARQYTDEFYQKGFRAPTTWVLTSGQKIPDDAIEAGKEGDKPLYAARAYVEVKFSFMINSMMGHSLIRTFNFNSGRTLYGFPSHTANFRVFVSDVASL